MPESIKIHEIPDVASALLVPGRKKPSFSRSGDALLIDPARGIFAVADGSERNPAASSHFLNKFACLTDDLAFLKRAVPFTPGSFDTLVEKTNCLVRDTGYYNTTTFSAFIGTRDGAAAMFHVGDSMIFIIRREDNTITQLSRSHHVMVGRASGLSQSEIVTYREGDIVLLATDGLTDLARCHGLLVEQFLKAHVTQLEPRHIVAGIRKCIEEVPAAMDDIGIIAANPLRTGGKAERVILASGDNGLRD